MHPNVALWTGVMRVCVCVCVCVVSQRNSLLFLNSSWTAFWLPLLAGGPTRQRHVVSEMRHETCHPQLADPIDAAFGHCAPACYAVVSTLAL